MLLKMEFGAKQTGVIYLLLLVEFMSNSAKGKPTIIEGDINIGEETSANVQTIAYTIRTNTWTSGQIPYNLDPSITIGGDIYNNVTIAMESIQNKTNNCINFYPKKARDTDYINITGSDSGCYSSVGRIGGTQVINIGPGCGIRGIIMHEFLHALGFWHEHSRTDRDNFVDIKKENIMPGRESNFDIRPDSTGVEAEIAYDYSSLLHYKYNQFSKLETLDTIVPNAEHSDVDKTVLGQREHLSDKDMARIMWLYKCDKATSCGPPNLDNNIQVSPEQHKYTFGTTVTFTCKSGTLIGDYQRVCMSSGHWSGTKPNCVQAQPPAFSCTPPDFENVTVKPGQSRYAFGTKVEFTCQSGHGTLIGASQSVCLSSGDWSGAKPYCVQEDRRHFHYCNMGDCFKQWWAYGNDPTWMSSSGQSHTINDHTNQNSDGIYLLMKGTTNRGAAITMSPPIFPGGGSPVCLMFFYYMYGEDLDSFSTLSVTITLFKSYYSYWPAKTWTWTGSTTEKKWYKKVIETTNVPVNIAIVKFTARKGRNVDKADVAIDDVLFGPCDVVNKYNDIINQADSKAKEYD